MATATEAPPGTRTFAFDLSDASLFGLSLSSHRNRNLGDQATTYFEHEAAIAAISILFFRTTVYHEESTLLRYFFAALLAGLTYFKKSYELIFAVELFSYAAAKLLRSPRIRRMETKEILQRLFYVSVSGISSMLLSHVLCSGLFLRTVNMILPSIAMKLLYYLIPIEEVHESYKIARAFAGPVVIDRQIHHLLFVTFHIQVGMGYLGIEFLRREQHRRNQLVRMDVDDMRDADDGDEQSAENDANESNGSEDPKEPKTENKRGETNDDARSAKQQKAKLQKARRFQRSAGPFILFTALPYMSQLIFYGGMNKYAFMCLQHDLHRTVRLNELFDHDSHLIATATETATSPDAYANSMDVVINTSYEFFNRKLFSLPKILLLPGVMAKQPMLVAQILPFILISDFVKAWAVALLTSKIEDFQKQIMELSAIRGKVEAFDMKNAELLQRSGKGSTIYTQRKWERLTVQIQARQVVSELLTRSKGFFAFMQRNFVFGVLIDCALASLLAIGKITSADTFVFSRAVEDTVDMILTRSRAEAELARMSTEQNKLLELHGIWEQSKERALLPCHVKMTGNKIVLRNLQYTRGTASVRADHVELEKGVYALTGANGSGKSTLFRVLMSCNTNENPIDFPASINLLTPAEPLMEEDDKLRAVACEVSDDKAVDSAEEAEPDEYPGGCAVVDESSGEATSTAQQMVPRLSVTMPSTSVSEISQNFYWPLYSKPIEFFFQSDEFASLPHSEVEERATQVATHLHSLDFFQPLTNEDEDGGEAMSAEDLEQASISRIADQLKEEREDWFGDLSGGQKSKAELVRKVFLQHSCPGVLLVDETMAPLDPTSKATVMKKLKSFCSESIIIVIYHSDATKGEDNGSGTTECVPSSGFFDHNIHLDHGILHVKATC